jgi:hypothetical protein
MKTHRLTFLSFFILLVLSPCCHSPEIDERLRIINNSDIDVYVEQASHRVDTDYIPLYYDIGNDPKKYKVYSGETKKYVVFQKWEDIFLFYKVDTLSLFIFDAEIIENTIWHTIPMEFKFLQRYDFTLTDLERMNWMVVYSPDSLKL